MSTSSLPRKSSEIPTDQESMAACLMGADNSETWRQSYLRIKAKDPAADRYLIMAQWALDHFSYIETLRRERSSALVFWLGLEAEEVA